MTRCLVTGGTGFIGSHIVKLLAAKGHDVGVLMRPSSSTELLDGVTYEKRVGDVTDAHSLDDAIPQDTEWLFHNAAIMTDWGGRDHYFPVNVEGTRNVLEAARRKDIQVLVYTSSTGVYGFPNSPEPMTEELPSRPFGEYQKSKAEAERLVREHSSVYGLKAAIVRPPTVLGRGDLFTGPQYIDMIRRGGMYCFSGGKNRASFAHAEDVASCFLLAAENIHKSAGRAYNVTSFTCQFRVLLDTLRLKLGVDKPIKSIPYGVAYGLGYFVGGTYRAFRVKKAPLVTSFRVKLFGTEYVVSDERARGELGYTPKWTLDSTVQDMVDWGGHVKPR